MANRCACAACSNIIVICHVDIEDQLFHEGSEGACFAESFAVAWVGTVHGADLETGGEHLNALFSKEVSCRKGLVSKVGIVRKSEGEFSMGEVVGGGWAVIQPMEELAKGKEALIEGTHYFGIREG